MSAVPAPRKGSRGGRSRWAQRTAAIISHCITLIRSLIYEAVEGNQSGHCGAEQLLLREAFPPSLTFVCLRQSRTLLKRTKAARKVECASSSGGREGKMAAESPAARSCHDSSVRWDDPAGWG